MTYGDEKFGTYAFGHIGKVLLVFWTLDKIFLR